MTHLSESLVTLPSKHLMRAKYRYHPEEIKKLAQELFGSDFLIRRSTEVYLPVHTLVIQNSDGSVQYSRFNALSGKPIESLEVGCG